MKVEAFFKERRAGRRILVMGGDETPSVTAANIYAQALKEHDLRFIEERVMSFGRSVSFSLKRLKNKGLISLAGCYLYYLRKLVQGEKKIARNHRLECRTPSLSTDPAVRECLARFKPELILIGFCGILSPDFLKQAACPIINIHPGINPRYRGLGNIWAFYEQNPSLTGYTIHEVDKGVDTGRRLAVGTIDFSGVAFDAIDTHAARLAARHLVGLIKGEAEPAVPAEFADLPSVFYGVPTLSEYAEARRQYERLFPKEG